MKTSIKLGAGALAVVVLGGGYLAGQVLGADPAGPVAAAASGNSAPAEFPGGLLISQDGLTLRVLADILPAGTQHTFAFQILEPDGTPLLRFNPRHGKLLHLILARRDLSRFQHVHPTLGADGTWRVPLTLPAAGEYRIFADFVAGWNSQPTTLGADISVPGDYRPVPLPPASGTAAVDDYTVDLAGTAVPGRSSRLTLRVMKNGKPVTDLEPYLAAYGHLVALRDGDLAYLHVHPADAPHPAGPDIGFSVTVPTAGGYRLYLDFQHQGVVRTAEFTIEVNGPNPPPNGLTPEQFDTARARGLSGGDGSEAGDAGSAEEHSPGQHHHGG
ncbi:MAG TPA: hypothetical protein VFV67_09705 [Actinophytocola sp.]|uniref:hypothetical protein n=1 Tax=Actinophytocola sp. TaxID=1872138 RepID=UPI002DB93E2B|nr:hypothetical protein [Actinophytocola sp.]HEU5470914.1 hypothetical protein [Actinophytocola sp.]